MKNHFLTESEFVRRCPCGHSALDYAATFNNDKRTWIFNLPAKKQIVMPFSISAGFLMLKIRKNSLLHV